MKRIGWIAFASGLTISCSAPGRAPLAFEQTASAARAAEEAASKMAQALEYSFREKDHPELLGLCLSELDVQPADFCGESYAHKVVVAWDACPVWSGGSSTGRIDIANDFATLPAGTPCEDADRYALSHDSTYDFLAERASGERHETHVAVSTTSEQHFEGPPPVRVAADVDVSTHGEDAAGALLYEVTVAGTYSTEWDETTIPSTRIVNGHTNVHLTRLAHDYDVDAVDLVYPPDCCHPTDGSITVAIELDGVQYSGRAEFGPACGEATVDAEPIELAPCTP